MKNLYNSHLLIQQLSIGEKRFLTKQLMQNKQDGTYKAIYDVLISEKTFNKKQVIQELEAIPIQNIGALSFKFYEWMLSKLKDQYRDTSPSYKLSELMRSVRLLFNKGLFEQAKERLDKAKKLASETGQYLDLLSILDMEERLTKFWPPDKANIDDRQSQIAEKKEVVGQLVRSAKIRQTSSSLNLLANMMFTMRLSSDGLNFKPITELPHEQSFDQIDNVWDKMKVYEAKGQYAFSSGDYATSLEYHTQVLAWIETDAAWTKDTPDLYLPLLYKTCVSALRCNEKHHFRTAFKMLTLMCDELRSDTNFSSIVNSQLLNIKLQYYVHAKRYEQALELLVPKLKTLQASKMDRYQMNLHLLSCFLVACCYFGEKQHDAAYTWLMKLLQNPSLKRLDFNLYCTALIFQLILQYELKMIELLPYSIRSVIRLLKNKEVHYQTEQVLLDLLQQLIRSNRFDHQSILKHFQNCHDQLVELRKDPKEQKSMEYFDFIAWLNGKINGTANKTNSRLEISGWKISQPLHEHLLEDILLE